MELDQVQDEPNTQRVAVAWDEEGEPTDGFVIVGKDSEEYQKTIAGQRQKAIRRQAVKRTRFDLKTEEGAEQLDATLRQNEFEIAAAVVVGWYGFTVKGEPAKFVKERVVQILAVKPSWKDRILAALEDDAAFLKSSEPTSVPTSKPALVVAKEAKTA
jgi:hypothetical protein